MANVGFTFLWVKNNDVFWLTKDFGKPIAAFLPMWTWKETYGGRANPYDVKVFFLSVQYFLCVVMQSCGLGCHFVQFVFRPQNPWAQRAISNMLGPQ